MYFAAMLEIRPCCENCDKDLPFDALDAMICSFECTFCAGCSESILKDMCPNCSGELVRRPIRPASKLIQYPPQSHRHVKAADIEAHRIKLSQFKTVPSAQR